LFVARSWRVLSFNYQENPTNGSRDTAERYDVLQVKGSFYVPIATKLPTFVTLAWREQGGSRDTALKVLSSPSKFPLIIDPIATKRISFVVRAWKVRGLKFQENPFSGGGDTAD